MKSSKFIKEQVALVLIQPAYITPVAQVFNVMQLAQRGRAARRPVRPLTGEECGIGKDKYTRDGEYTATKGEAF